MDRIDENNAKPKPPFLPPATAPAEPRPAPARARSRTGRTWIVLTVLLAVALFLSLLINFSQFLASFASLGVGTGGSRPWLQETVLRDNDSPHRIAVIDISGLILSDAWQRSGYGLVQHVKRQLQQAGESRAVKAAILRVDSPGGEVLASDDISTAIREFQDKYHKPVVAALGGLAASGGYYVAVPSQWIVANELTITGSIGVILHGYNYRGLLDKVGIQPRVFKSGPFKDMLSGDRRPEEIRPEEQEMVQGLIDETYERFKTVVRQGRSRAQEKNGDTGKPLADNWEQYADGRIFSGQKAFEYGFVDELGNFDAAVERTLKLAHLPDANLIRYQRPFDLSDLFSILGTTETRSLKIDWGVDWPRLQAGRLYFLCPIALP